MTSETLTRPKSTWIAPVVLGTSTYVCFVQTGRGLLPYGYFALWLLRFGFYRVKSWLRLRTLEMHSKCIRLRRFILHSEYGKMPAHDFLIGRNQPTVRPIQVKHPIHTVGYWPVKSVNDGIVFAWFPELPGSMMSADTESRVKKQRTAHKQEQKVNSWKP